MKKDDGVPRNSTPEEFDVTAIAKGVVTAILLGFAVGFLWGLCGIAAVLATGNAVSDSIALRILGFAVSILPNLIGGFVAARAVGHGELKHAFVTGLVLLVFTGLSDVVLSDSAFGWTDGAYLLVIVPITVLGGRLGSASTE